MRKQSSASDLLAYLRLAVAPADDAAMLTALAIPARGFGAGGVAVKYLKQAAAQRGGGGALLAAAQVRFLCICEPHSSFPFATEVQPYGPERYGPVYPGGRAARLPAAPGRA